MSERPKACRGCGAALAADQRYCLNCGERQGGPRVEYRGQVAPPVSGQKPAAPPPTPPATAGAGEKRQRDYAPLAAAAGIAVLGIMLLIGVLIGRGTGSSGSDNQVPQVVTVESDGGKTASGEVGEGSAEGTASGGGKSKKSGSGKASKETADSGEAPVASEADLRALQEQSPEDYQKSSAKLPDEIATPGAAPPTDEKAPGGGSAGTTIE